MPLSVIRRLEVLENQVQELSTLPARLGGVESRLTGVEDRLTVVEGRLTTVEDRLTGVEGRLTTVEDRLTGVEGRLTTVEVELHSLRGEFEEFRIEVRTEFASVRADIGDTQRQMRVLHEDVIARIALLQEGVARINGDKSRTRPRKRK